MAGFEVITYGRFWVTAEAILASHNSSAEEAIRAGLRDSGF
jgi:hypothetical protein